MFFQDQEMKQAFAAYPELVCVDTTYKLLELRFPVYVMLIEDGNGLSKIVAMFLLLKRMKVQYPTWLMHSKSTIEGGNLLRLK